MVELETFPDAHYSDDRHWVVGNMGFSEWTLRGTTPTGEQVEVCGTDHLEFNDEVKIVRKNSFWKIIQKLQCTRKLSPLFIKDFILTNL